MEPLGIKRVMCHTEKAAAYMADGYARAARRPGVAFAQSVGAANLAAGLQDAFSGPLSGHRAHRTLDAGISLSPRLPGDRSLAALPAGHQVQRLGGRRRPASDAAAPGVPRGRLRLARAGPSGPSRHRRRAGGGRRSRRRGDRRFLVSELSRLPATARRWTDPRRGGVAQAGAATGAASWRRRHRFSSRSRDHGAGREALHAGRHVAQRQGVHSRGPPAVGRRARHLLALVRQPGRLRSRPGADRGQPDRRAGHALLARAQARRSHDSDQRRSRRAWPQLSQPG